jgi:hypothetical protein
VNVTKEIMTGNIILVVGKESFLIIAEICLTESFCKQVAIVAQN